MAATLRTASCTVAGRRASNQDAVLVHDLPDGRTLLVVADGMGGHQAGEEASRQAVACLVDALTAGAALVEAFKAANARIHAAASENAQWTGMGTTLVALLRTGDRYEVANVGDSRAYRIGSAGVGRITDDHSVLAEAERNGGAALSEMRDSPWRNALTRALGTDPDIEVDLFGPFSVNEPHAVVLCTDGLYRSVTDQDLAHWLAGATDLQEAAVKLVEGAVTAGSSDNVSVVVAVFDGEGTAAAAARAEQRQPGASSSAAPEEDIGEPWVDIDRTSWPPNSTPRGGRRRQKDRHGSRRKRHERWRRWFEGALYLAALIGIAAAAKWSLG